jgi:hypothetical protein
MKGLLAPGTTSNSENQWCFRRLSVLLVELGAQKMKLYLYIEMNLKNKLG